MFFVSLFAAAFAAAAIFWSPWFVVPVLVLLALMAAMWMAPRRMQRRIDLLAEPDRDRVSPNSGGQPLAIRSPAIGPPNRPNTPS